MEAENLLGRDLVDHNLEVLTIPRRRCAEANAGRVLCSIGYMTVAGHRHERVAGEIRYEISAMLAGELKDPRLIALATVTEVRMTPDLKQARVYVSVMGTEAEQASTIKGLTAAAGFIRHELSARDCSFAARPNSSSCSTAPRSTPSASTNSFAAPNPPPDAHPRLLQLSG